MPIDLFSKDMPDDLVTRLRARAERHGRSLEDELMAIIQAAVSDDRPATPTATLAQVRRIGLRTPSEAAELVRMDRDAR